MISLSRRTVCAVVVTYNRADLLDVCLRALGNQTHTVDHIIVVDNASTDHTSDVLDAHPNLDVVRLPSNAGSAGGFAAGIKRAAEREWDLVWVMDDDVEPEPQALTFLIEAMEPGVAASGPVKVGSDGEVQPLHIAQYDLARMRKQAVVPGEREVVDVSFLSFVGLLIRGDVARSETPRSDFFIDADDTEYCVRLSQHGRLVGVGSSRVIHHNKQAQHTRRALGRTVLTKGKWRVYYAVRNPLLISRTHATPNQWRVSVVVAAAQLALRFPAALFHHRGDVRRWLLAVRGFVDGLRGRSGFVIAPSDYA